MKLRRARAHKRGRIEIIPMIDIIFFLLATFMLTSLAMQRLNSLAVNLPQGQAAPMVTKKPVTLTITRDSAIMVNEAPVTLQTLAITLKPLMTATETDVIVSADEAAPQGTVVQAMLAARTAGAQNFLIAVKHAQ